MEKQLMPITPYLQRTRGHRTDTCNDQVVGAILSGWRYDISSVPKDLRGDYEAHLSECTHCRKRQRVHRTVDILLLAVTTLSFAAFLLAAVVVHRLEMVNHLSPVHHVRLHAAEDTGALARIPASVAISLEALALGGVVVSMLLWLLVALATPAPSMLSAMFRQRYAHDRGEELNKQAA
jgi:hypothetical protein